MHRLESEPPAHALGLEAAVVEGDQWHHVACSSLEVHALAARQLADAGAQPPRIVRRVADVLDAGRDRVRAVPDDGRDRGSVVPDRLQHGHRAVDEAVGVPADAGHPAVGIALAAVDRQGRPPEPVADPRRLEAPERGDAGGDDRVVQPLDVGQRGGVGVGIAFTKRPVDRPPAGRGVMRVVPVEQDAGARRPRLGGNSVANRIDLGSLDREGVDAAEHDADGVALEGRGRYLERAEALARGLVPPYDAHHGEPQGRIDVRGRSTGPKCHPRLLPPNDSGFGSDANALRFPG